MNKYVYRLLCKKYEQSARAMVSEMRKLRNDIAVSANETVKEYQENLKMLRLFLDNSGCPMPVPRWHYNPYDKSTWLFNEHEEVNKNFLMLRSRRG